MNGAASLSPTQRAIPMQRPPHLRKVLEIDVDETCLVMQRLLSSASEINNVLQAAELWLAASSRSELENRLA